MIRFSRLCIAVAVASGVLGNASAQTSYGPGWIYETELFRSVPGLDDAAVVVMCPPGEAVEAGGHQIENNRSRFLLTESAPYSGGGGWIVKVINRTSIASSVELTAFARCAPTLRTVPDQAQIDEVVSAAKSSGLAISSSQVVWTQTITPAAPTANGVSLRAEGLEEYSGAADGFLRTATRFGVDFNATTGLRYYIGCRSDESLGGGSVEVTFSMTGDSSNFGQSMTVIPDDLSFGWSGEALSDGPARASISAVGRPMLTVRSCVVAAVDLSLP